MDHLVDKVAFRLYSGGTEDFHSGIEELQIVVSLRREQAARELAFLVAQKLMLDGYIVRSDIDDCVTLFLDKELENQYADQAQEIR